MARALGVVSFDGSARPRSPKECGRVCLAIESIAGLFGPRLRSTESFAVQNAIARGGGAQACRRLRPDEWVDNRACVGRH